MLDLLMIHGNQSEEFQCSNEFMTTFIDDVFTIIEGIREDTWNRVDKYVKLMEQYYNSNVLKINVDKSQIMISAPNNTTVEGSLIIGNKLIQNTNKIKILGTYFSQDCNFHVNLLEGSNSLLTQLRRRSQALKCLSKYFPIEFKIQLINALLYGKLRYNIVTWGNL